MKRTVTALWDLNESCNLRCVYCYHIMNGEEWSHIQQPLPDIQRTMEFLRAAGITRLYFVGGEPFLRRDIGTIAQEAKRLGFETCVTTNGTMLPCYRNPPLMDSFDRVEISLDSIDAGYMAEIRTVQRLNTIQTAITELVQSGRHVQLLAVVNKLSLRTLPNLVEWCADVGVTRLKIQPIFLPEENRNHARLALDAEDLQALRAYTEEIYEPHPGVKSFYEYTMACANGRERRHLCNAFSQFVYVTADGQILRCPSLRDPVDPGLVILNNPQLCNKMSLDCLCVFSLIEDFEFVLKTRSTKPSTCPT